MVDSADEIEKTESRAIFRVKARAKISPIESCPCFVPGPCSPGQSQLKVARFIWFPPDEDDEAIPFPAFLVGFASQL